MSGYTTAAKNAALNAIGVLATWISFHTADPGSTGVNEVAGGAYARVQTTWGAASAAAMAGSAVTANIPASTTIAYWGVWSASSGGSFEEGGLLPVPETYGGAGTYTFTPTLTATG